MAEKTQCTESSGDVCPKNEANIIVLIRRDGYVLTDIRLKRKNQYNQMSSIYIDKNMFLGFL